MKWTEDGIARALACQVFQRKQLVVVPNCNWTGHECDLLIVRHDLRLVDVEIKISVADLRRDGKKDKWFHPLSGGWPPVGPLHPRRWPAKIWKHYYALPADLWTPDLAPDLEPASGVIVLSQGDGHGGGVFAEVKRQAKANRDAKPITAAELVDIARLASMRMWQAVYEVERFLAREGDQFIADRTQR